jgi:sensor c-di-GMP phosphodiesterase-like protein
MSDGHAKVRVYDVSTARISNTVDLDLEATDTQIRRRIIAAINPENMIPVTEVVLVDKRGGEKKWYQKWYVWVGAAAIVGGGALGVHYMTRDPMSATGF